MPILVASTTAEARPVDDVRRVIASHATSGFRVHVSRSGLLRVRRQGHALVWPSARPVGQAPGAGGGAARPAAGGGGARRRPADRDEGLKALLGDLAGYLRTSWFVMAANLSGPSGI